MKRLINCFKPSCGASGSNVVGDEVARTDGLLWYRDVGRHAAGEFSMAVVQANEVLEDQSQIKSGQFGTFVGVYDGHGGPEAARFVCDDVSDPQTELTTQNVTTALVNMEEAFRLHVAQLWSTQPRIATVGTCCLVGMIYKQTLFVSNLGDSRAVLGKKIGTSSRMSAVQLSMEHNAKLPAIQHELRSRHPDDPNVVEFTRGSWRVKGICEVSRSIGDEYLKHEEYNRAPLGAKFLLAPPLNMPYMTADPSTISHQLHPNDSFIIFASDGLWDVFSNEQAVEIVRSCRPAGSAKTLVKAALGEVAARMGSTYAGLCDIGKGGRRQFHDDITVIILFLNHDCISKGSRLDHPFSFRSALNHDPLLD